MNFFWMICIASDFLHKRETLVLFGISRLHCRVPWSGAKVWCFAIEVLEPSSAVIAYSILSNLL